LKYRKKKVFKNNEIFGEYFPVICQSNRFECLQIQTTFYKLLKVGKKENQFVYILVYLPGEWRKFHNKELHDLNSSPSIIRIIKSRRMRWAGHVARMGEKRNVYRLLVGKPEGKRPLERPRRRCVDNIKMDLGEVGWGDVDWIDLAMDRNRWRALVNSVLNLRVP
jgi:hypothetical protein